MSLVRLLTAGKSLVGMAAPVTRYRMRGRNVLPKFGSLKNPFTETGTEPCGPVARYQMTPAELAAARLKETRRLPPSAFTPPAEEPAPQASRSARLERLLALMAPLRKWMGKLNPIGWWPRRDTAPKPAIPRFNEKPPVQGELSLDNVKVVRNDLSDADLEIVSARPVRTKPAPAARVEDAVELMKT